ncbi:MAG: aminopeptidase P family N-terminal domain-containing protein, partial [Pseudomonadota bacterium]
MFQSFTSTSNPEMGPERLAELRKVMDKAGVTAFLVPHADEHQNEYLPERAERLAWLTGFSGSAGFAIATLSDCYVFVDGRYTLQVREQTDPDAFTPESLIDNPPSAWLAKNTSTEDVIAYDPWLITAKQLETFEKSAAKSGAKLKPVANLIDQIWLDQPDAPLGSLKLHPENYAGKSAQAKIQNIQSKITEQSCELCLLTDPASLAWLFNIRGSDVVHNPLALGFAIVPTSAKPIL